MLNFGYAFVILGAEIKLATHVDEILLKFVRMLMLVIQKGFLMSSGKAIGLRVAQNTTSLVNFIKLCSRAGEIGVCEFFVPQVDPVAFKFLEVQRIFDFTLNLTWSIWTSAFEDSIWSYRCCVSNLNYNYD